VGSLSGRFGAPHLAWQDMGAVAGIGVCRLNACGVPRLTAAQVLGVKGAGLRQEPASTGR
jgi:hypothetical protein